MPSNGAHAVIATQNNSTVYVARQRTSIGFKLAVCGGTGAGGLVAPSSTYCLSIEAQTLVLSRVMKLPRFNNLNKLCYGHSKVLTWSTVRTATSCSSHIDTEEASIQPVQLPHIQPVQLPHTYTTVVYLLP